MMLAHPLLQSPIEFKENRVPVLIVENGQLFRQLIADLLADCIHPCSGDHLAGAFCAHTSGRQIEQHFFI